MAGEARQGGLGPGTTGRNRSAELVMKMINTSNTAPPERRPECRFSRVRRYPRVSPMGERCRTGNSFRVLAALLA